MMLGSMYRRMCVKCTKQCSSWQQPVRHFKQKRNVRETKPQSSVKQQQQPQQTAAEKKGLEYMEQEVSASHLSNGPMPVRVLVRPFLFSVAVTGCSFGGAAIWQYESMRSKALKRFIDNYQGYFRTPKTGEMREMLHQWYDKLNGTEKVTLGIIAANILVFCCWRTPRLQPAMLKWFTASPASKALCLPMVLSTFSHHAVWHLGINMYVLWSFSRSIGHTFGQEQFLAFYLSAGVWSSYASYVVKVLRFAPGVSLGASGAIMGVLGAFCVQHPDAQLAIVFLPFFTFSAGMGFKALLALESTGVVLGWRIFDHAAHLGGALAGASYMLYGQKHLWGGREPFVAAWHKWRGKPKDV